MERIGIFSKEGAYFASVWSGPEDGANVVDVRQAGLPSPTDEVTAKEIAGFKVREDEKQDVVWKARKVHGSWLEQDLRSRLAELSGPTDGEPRLLETPA